MTIPTPDNIRSRLTTVKTQQISSLRGDCTVALNTASRMPVSVPCAAVLSEGVVDIVLKELQALGWSASYFGASQRADARIEIDFDRNDDPTGY